VLIRPRLPLDQRPGRALERFLQELGLLKRKPPTLFSKLTRPVFKKVDTLLRTSLGPS